jgi:hypothetical protein
MARFYGTIQGARGPTSRLGSPRSGLSVTAQSYSGDIQVHFRDEDGEDSVSVYAKSHDGGGSGLCLYSGSMKDLLDMNQRGLQILALTGGVLAGHDEHEIRENARRRKAVTAR